MIFNAKAYSQTVAFTRRPDITEELHPYLNYSKEATYADNGLLVFTQKSKAWWEGKCGHTYKSSLASRLSGSDCPICSKPPKQLLYGFNDLVSTTPDITKRWNYKRNAPLGLHPEDFFKGSSETVWWQGEDCQHEWQDLIQKQVPKVQQKTGCPLCSGGRRRTIAGVNDLLTTHPDLAAELNVTKSGFDATAVSAGSGKAAWWTCKEGHEIKATVKGRVRHYCVYCAGQKAIPGVNDMVTTHPEIAAHFHPTKNGTKKPVDFMMNTGNILWWLCDRGHTFDMKGDTYVKNYPGCPVCSSHRIENGFNDMITTHPELLTEWDFQGNERKPDEVSAFSNYIASWKCPKGHVTKTAMYNRAAGKGCPVCGVGNISNPEEALKEFLKSKLPHLDIQKNKRNIIKGELDIYIPEKNIAIEFNGLYWHSEAHKDRQYHYNKYKDCKDKGIQLIQIWEDDWEARQDFIKLALLHKLQETDPSLRVGARKLVLKRVSQIRAAEFLDKNHIQGQVESARYYALASKAETEDIKAVLAIKKVNKKHPGRWSIERYATNIPVAGGFTRLLKYAEKQLKSENEIITQWVTFSDNCISDGGLYANNGFTLDKELEPDYMYFGRGQRIRSHKFNYRLKRFRNDTTLKWQEGLTEKELAQLNGLLRIWDSGKIRWVRAVS